MRNLRIVVAAGLAAAALAFAPALAQTTAPAPQPAPALTLPATVALPAPANFAAPSIAFLAPYTGSGWYIGIEAGGGAGSAGVTGIPGVNNAALVQTQGLVGGIFGYSSDMSNGSRYWFAEGDIGWNNFNGNTAGFSVGGPVTIQGLVGIGAPASEILSILPTFGITAPTLPTVAGASTTNPHIYAAVGIDVSDISAAYALSQNSDWQFSPLVAIGIEAPLSTGGVIGARTEYVIQADSVCVGGMCAKTGNLIREKVLFKF